jgi:hypothetical protein
MPALIKNKYDKNQKVIVFVENVLDASCTMIRLQSCVMHDEFAGTFNIFGIAGRA